MPGEDVEVYYQDDEWRVGVPTGEDPISRHDTKDQAIDAGRAEAEQREVELIIRDRRGTITEREVEANDPPDVSG